MTSRVLLSRVCSTAVLQLLPAYWCPLRTPTWFATIKKSIQYHFQRFGRKYFWMWTKDQMTSNENDGKQNFRKKVELVFEFWILGLKEKSEKDIIMSADRFVQLTQVPAKYQQKQRRSSSVGRASFKRSRVLVQPYRHEFESRLRHKVVGKKSLQRNLLNMEISTLCGI